MLLYINLNSLFEIFTQSDFDVCNRKNYLCNNIK